MIIDDSIVFDNFFSSCIVLARLFQYHSGLIAGDQRVLLTKWKEISTMDCTHSVC